MEIRDKQKQINYDTKQYPVEILLQKYMEWINPRTNKEWELNNFHKESGMGVPPVQKGRAGRPSHKNN
jgi:hypothetical protein